MKLDYQSPILGAHLDISNTPDETFSSYMAGQGFVVFPIDNQIYSPVDGTITHIFPNKHAFVIKHDSGINLLIHIGLGTGELKGEGVHLLVEQSQQVKQGDHLAHFDFDFLKTHIEALVVLVVFVQKDSLTILNQNHESTYMKMILDVQ